MNNNKSDDFELSFEDIKKEANETLDKFELMVEEQIKRVSRFDRRNINQLFKMILDDCQDLSELEEYTQILLDRIQNNIYLKEKLAYQRTLTKKDIIDENIIKIYLIYNVMLGTVWVTSSDMLAFIRNFLISFLIGASTFGVNLKYFTSDYRKEQIDRAILELDKSIEINRYDVSTFNKFRQMYIKELTFEVKRLFELVKDRNDNYAKIEKFLSDVKIDFLLDDNSIKRKIRKK